MTNRDGLQKSPSNRRKRHSLEWAAAAVLGILSIGCFALQAYTASTQTTARETALYNALQFLLTTGFAWFSTRAISRGEFEDSLRRFAISAYRRVADIERMTQRLHTEIRVMIAERPTKTTENLRIVEAIVADTGQIVRSSIADWADVIGDELLAIERIKRLEQERQDLKSEVAQQPEDAAGNESMRQIDAQIRALLSSLPPRLQLEAERQEGMSREEQHAARWVRRTHERESGFLLTVVTGDRYDTQRAQETLQSGEQLRAAWGSDRGIDVIDREGKILGRLQNPSPLSYDAFARAFEICYGVLPIAVAFLRVIGRDTRESGEYGWFEIRVVSSPVFEPE